MTYVSRKSRIIFSRWSDECNPEYIFEAFRKRSDGRLKNYSSCDDLRAWVNDNCIKNEHLLDLMSKNEFLGKPPFALYGRFIPVPILFKLLENSKANENDAEKNQKESESENLSRVQWEKNQAEKNLFECSCLLNTAVRKLEKVENIIEMASSEIESARAKQIQDAFSKARASCACSACKSSSLSSCNENSEIEFTATRKKSKDTDTYNELMRKISQLKKKLEEVKACRCEIIHQIRKAEKCASSNQVKELFNRKDQDLIKKLQKELEKLIAEKGRLLSEMCHVLNSLNALKISSNGNFNSRKRNLSSDGNCAGSKGRAKCKCGCKKFENYESSDSENFGFSESTFTCDEKPRRTRDFSCDYSEPPERLSPDCRDEEPEKLSNNRNPVECPESRGTSSKHSRDSTSACHKLLARDPCSTSSLEKSQKVQKSKCANGKKKEKTKKSKVKFTEDPSPCAKKLYPDDLAAFENALTPAQKAVISKAVKNLQNKRPRTTPTTEREKRESAVTCGPSKGSEKIALRRVKSETMIKEFEKTLRNYERRLNNLDSLECKLETLKQKSLEVNRLRKKLSKVKEESKKQKIADKEKFNSEITRLCSENWELKKHVQQLTAKLDAQNEKIKNLKCTMMRARELECEAEELKKELSEYRDGFEHQRKCISKWESVVAMQRTEIENLMNHIRKLTAVKEESQCHLHQDRKNVQRSRSYSPEKGKEKSRIRRKISKEFRLTSEEEENGCCCGEQPQLDGKKKIQLRSLSRGCFTPSNGSINRY